MNVPKSSSANPSPRFVAWKAHWSALVMVLEELEGLITAHVPLAGGLLALAEDAPNRRMRRLFHSLHTDISNGAALHEALAVHSGVFPPYCVDAVRAGEDSGRLPEVLHGLQTELREMLAFRTRVEATGSYLFSVLLMEALLILAIISFVLPQALEITYRFGKEPALMMRLLATAHAWGLPYLLLLIAVAVPMLWMLGQAASLRGGQLARVFANLVLRVPLLGRIPRHRYLANAAAIAEVLVEAGMPLHEAMKAAGNATPAQAFRAGFHRVAQRLEQGQSLREALQQDAGLFPAGFRGLLALGESSGQLPQALQQVKALYRAQALRNARLLLEIGGPLVLCLAGACVFVVYFAFFEWISTLWTLVAT